MRKFGLLFVLYFGVFSVALAQYEHFKRGYTCKNYDTLAAAYKMVSWDDSQYEEFEYFVTQNATGPVLDFMNFRLIFPNNYDSSGNTKYPMIVMLHGAGESGRSWTYHYIYYPGDPEFDNNSKQLLLGGQQHRDAVNRDPSNSRAFPGFVLFAQVQNNGNWDGGWLDGALSPRGEKVVKIIEHIIDTYNVDPNRIAMHGLSNGAKGVWDVASKRPDLFAAILPMSGVGRELDIQTTTLTTMPIWLFQGGLDSNPQPTAAEDWINALEAKGSRPRFYLYPDLGHATWNRAYAEPDFFSWILQQDKRNIYVFGGNGETGLCDGGQLTLGFSEGFNAYQWTKDGVDIPGATTTRLIVTQPGVYAVRFQRINGADSLNWDNSNDLEITPKLESTFTPPVAINGSLALPTPYAVGLTLSGPIGYSEYHWYQDGNLVSTTTTNDFIVVQNYSVGNDPALAGSYTLSVLEPSGCESLISDPVVVSYGTGANAPLAPTNAHATATSASEVDVTWTDNATNEDYYELWYAYGFGSGNFSGWKMLTTLPANTTSYHHSGLLPETKYAYFSRATNYDGANISNISNQTLTFPDLIAPTAPSNLLATGIGADTVGLAWDEAYDNISIKRYNIYVDGDSVGNSTTTTFTLTGLIPLTSYNVSVRAVDYSNNYSSFSNAIWVTTTESDPGLVYNIYDHPAWSLLKNIDFSTLTPTTTGVISTFDISARQGTDYYAYSFDGYIKITTAGTYTFRTTSDDGSMLYLDGTTLIDNDGTHGSVTVSGSRSLTAGYHQIRVEFFENAGGDLLTVDYSGADTGGSTTVIPASVLFQNAPPTYNVFYSDGSGDLAILTNWGTNPAGNGTEPTNFTNDYQTFIITNRSSTSVDNPWTVSGVGSKVVVSNGVTLSLNAQLAGKVDVEDGAILNLNNALPPQIGDCGPTSIVNVNTNLAIPQGNYGYLNVVGSQAQFSSNTTFVQNNFTSDAASSIKGDVNNQSTLLVSGDITVGASMAGLTSSELFTLDIVGSGAHTVNLPAEDVSFYEITSDFGAVITIENNTLAPTNLTLGSTIGGGLSLESTSQLVLNNINLNIIGAGTINPGLETGVISIDSANISITSTTDLNSNLYFDGTNFLVNDLDMNLTGNGTLTLFNGVNIANKIKVSSGELNVNNSVTLLGSDTKTAFIDVVDNGGSIIGNMKMQRYIRQGAMWRYFSSPFSGTTVADWQETMPITGNFTGTSVIPGVTSGPSLYYYDESLGIGDAGWVVYPPSGGTNAAVIQTGVGYAMWVRADTGPMVFDMTGEPNQGDITFSLTPDPTPGSGDVPNDGWSLIGNPYASAIKWDVDGNGWTSIGINDVIYVRDNEDPTWWKYYDRSTGLGNLPNGEIAPGQAFYVRAISSSPTLIVSETAKSSGQPSFYRETTPKDYVSIYMHSGSETDVSYVIMQDNSLDSFEEAYDGVKKPSGTFGVSTLSTDNVSLAINKISKQFCSKTVNLSISNAQTGTYSLEFKDLQSFEVPMSIKLIDNFTSTVQDLLESNTYSFDVTNDAASSGNDRFVLEFDVNEIAPLTQIQSENSCDQSAPLVTLEGTFDNVHYQVFENGQPVSDAAYGQANNLTTLEINPSFLSEGNHTFTVLAWNDVCGNKTDLGEVSLDFYNLSVDITDNEGTLVSSSEMGNQWLFNGNIIDGATTQSFTPTETGDYSVLLTKGSCQIESPIISYVVTGLRDSNLGNAIAIYPNPVTDHLTIEIKDVKILGGHLTILNSNGKLLIDRKLNANTCELNVGTLPNGLYLIRIVSNDKLYEGKFSK